jgi:hypothetical protein
MIARAADKSKNTYGTHETANQQQNITSQDTNKPG